ncbi:MAG TPA: arylamine N-acetyltransferase [Thermohalobaculum sp.]|nr:arylamine N-acetyltransferase [Thermohalobaculum sp.]
MWLDAYLERIGYGGPVAPTLDCLKSVHRAHALSVPYENLDIQLGRPVWCDIDRIVEKIVTRRRGGWCYEMNTLLAHGLMAIGFDVRLVTGGIHRFERGDAALGNHILALVDLDRTYVADLGLGDGLREPVPLAEGSYAQGTLGFQLSRLADGFWRFTNHAGAYPVSFDFSESPVDPAAIEARNRELQTSPDSVFVQNLIIQRMRADTLVCLTGRVFQEKSASDSRKKMVWDAAEMEALVSAKFGIDDPEIASVWPRVEARHRALFGDRDVADLAVSTFGRPTV